MKTFQLAIIFSFLLLTPILFAKEEIDCRNQVALQYAIKHAKAKSCSSLSEDLVEMRTLFALCDTADNKKASLTSLLNSYCKKRKDKVCRITQKFDFTPAAPLDLLAQDHPLYDLDQPMFQFLRQKVSPALSRKMISELYQFEIFSEMFDGDSFVDSKAVPSDVELFRIIEVFSIAKFKDVATAKYQSLYHQYRNSNIVSMSECTKTLKMLGDIAFNMIQDLTKAHAAGNKKAATTLKDKLCREGAPFAYMLMKLK